MNSISALNDIHIEGLFGDHEGKNENELLKLSELNDFLIVQIVKYKKSLISNQEIKIDNLNLSDETLTVSCNNSTRILWSGPNNWLLVSKKKKF